jgi:uncharacterized membrane protein
MLDYCLNHPQLLPVLLLAVAVATTLLALGRFLPAQNVLAAAAIIAALSGLIQIAGATLGTPFGRFIYTQNAGPKLFGVLPWMIPLIWIVVILNARGVARLILRPRRASPNIGLWTIALSCLLAVLFDAGLEPYAAGVNHYWIWQTPQIVPAWNGVPWTDYFGWAIASLLILTVSSPWLINKKPVSDPPPDYFPLLIWLLLTLFLAVCDATHRFSATAVLSLAMAVVGTFFVWKNSHDQK